MMTADHINLFTFILRPKNIFCLLLFCICSNTLYAQQLSPAEAAASARNFTDGKVLKVKPIQGNKINYRVKILSPEGRVRNIIVDGNNGEIILHKRTAKRKKKMPERQQLLETGY
jgi:hypothetical protein